MKFTTRESINGDSAEEDRVWGLISAEVKTVSETALRLYFFREGFAEGCVPLQHRPASHLEAAQYNRSLHPTRKTRGALLKVTWVVTERGQAFAFFLLPSELRSRK